jgi:hypothetical protein
LIIWKGGETLDEFLDDFLTVSRENAVAALEEAKSLVIAQLHCGQQNGSATADLANCRLLRMIHEPERPTSCMLQ